MSRHIHKLNVTSPLNYYFYGDVPCGFSNPLVNYPSFISTVMS